MDDTPSDDESKPTVGGISRRTLIRVLVGGAIGIPIAVEGRTLIGLIDKQFFGGERHEATPTSDREAVSVGDELLPETTPVERVSRMVVDAPADTWTFRLDVEVDNTGDLPYEFQVGTVTTTNGPVEGSETTGQLEPDESRPLYADWTIPEGSTPTDVAVNGVIGSGEGRERVAADVPLGNVPVRRRS